MTSLWCRDPGLWGTKTFVLLFHVLVTYGVIGAVASAQTIIIPTLSVSEMYDSNVFFTPKTLLGPELKPEDFITTVTPQINVAHTGSLIRGNLSVGALVTKYLENPDLDYTGVNAAGRLDFLQLAQKVSQRMTSLSVIGSYQFTPSMSTFGASGGQYGAGYGTTTTGFTGLNSGLVTNRVSVQNANLGISGGYQLTRTTGLTGTYNYTSIFFGNQSGGAETQLFNTSGHNGTISLNTKLNPKDTVTTTGSISHYIQDQSNGEGQGSFTTPSAMLNWSRIWTQKLNTTLGGGAILILPIESTVPGQSLKTQVAPTIMASINYSSFLEGLRAAGSPPGPFDGLPSLAGSLNPGGIIQAGQYRASLTYNYSIYPSYAYGAGPTKAHVFGATASGGITSKLTGQAGVNLAHGSSADSLTSFTYDTVGVTVGARYLLGPILASLTYNWLYFANSAGQAAAGQSEYALSKKTVMLALSYAFTSQSFFRMDRIGSVAPPSAGEGSSGLSGGEPGSGPSGTGSGN